MEDDDSDTDDEHEEDSELNEGELLEGSGGRRCGIELLVGRVHEESIRGRGLGGRCGLLFEEGLQDLSRDMRDLLTFAEVVFGNDWAFVVRHIPCPQPVSTGGQLLQFLLILAL